MGRSTRRITVIALVALVAAVFATVPGGAFVTAATGQLVKVAPPANVTATGVCSPTQAFTFDEQQGVTLASPLKVNFTAPGFYAAATGGNPSIPAGTVVDSHFLTSNNCGGSVVRDGTWTFAQDILGVITARDKLDNSDMLGDPGTVYGGAYPSREFEFGTGAAADNLTIVDARTITVHLQTTGSTDQMRVITKHNSPPVPSAGGPYAGVEGASIPLSGSASDPDGDPVTRSWTISWAASPGTTCTLAGATTWTPTVSCDDDALVTATLSVTDGFHGPTTSSATVNVGNVAPVITAVTVPTSPVALGAPVALSGAFSDVGSHDTHAATVYWGDATSSTAGVNQITDTLSGSHVYSAPGSYPVTVVLTDDDGGTTSFTTSAIVVVGPPTASAGGPYTVDEGATVTLAGSASGSLPLTKSWVFTPGPSDPGTSCLTTGATTLSPTVGCNDDVVVDGQLTVTDGVNPPVVSGTTVTVTNVAPDLGPLSTTPGPIAVGQTVTVSGGFTDPGTNDTHTATVDWGDVAPTAAGLLESSGSGTVSATHAYTTPGPYTVTITVTDKDGGVDSRSITIVVNAPPTPSAGGPYVGTEGSTLTLGGSATDPNGDALTKSWSFSVSGAPGTACTYGATSTYSPTIQCNDDAVVTATLTVSDGVNAPVSDSTVVTVGNLSPSASALVATPDLTTTGTTVTATTTFTDPGTNDSHTATVDWGDGPASGASVSETLGSGTVSASHAYAAAGVYTVTIVITDDDGGSVTVTAPVVVYDPTGTFVTANGNFASPSGAYTPGNPSDPNYVGPAHIDFLVRPGTPTPTGHGTFRFRAADLEMEATGFTQLVVAGDHTSATFRGTGSVNELSGYEFLVSVIDGSPDRVRIKVWKTSDLSVLYDSQAGDPDTAAPTTPMTGSGIVIHG